MSRHLGACLAKTAAARGGERERLFHVAVRGACAPTYWMHLEIPARATLADLDGFLRRTWLECCDHLSAFEIDRTQHLPGEASEFDDESMDVTLGEVLRPGTEFTHTYDFGSSTHLALRVVSEYEGAPPGRKEAPVRVLARNDPPEIRCGKCGRPAVLVCPECMCGGGEGWLCKACAKRHEDECEGGERMLPVVNSPRVGVCGYCGPEDEHGRALAFKALDEEGPEDDEGNDDAGE
jgi:hypothetical protein